MGVCGSSQQAGDDGEPIKNTLKSTNGKGQTPEMKRRPKKQKSDKNDDDFRLNSSGRQTKK